MATSYPGAIDSFNEPTEPESTPTSEAGSGNTRNHYEHHRDIGDTLEAVQANASLKAHDHSGDGDGTREYGNKLDQANTHENVDTDVATTSLHHTIGLGATQAAAGNHAHNYADLINVPFKICTSTTRPGTPSTGMMIYETDTKSFRHWELYPNNVVVTGLNSLDDFPTPFTDGYGRISLNPADWEQWYSDDPADPDHGAMGVSEAGYCSWADEGSDSNICIARRINSADAETDDDDQVIEWMTGDIVTEVEYPLTEGASNDFYFRMSSDRENYIRLRAGRDYLKVFYTTSGPGNEQWLGTLNDVDTAIATTKWRGQMVGRTFSLFREGEFMGSIVDTKSVTAKGAGFRGWGIGMESGDRVLGQTTPGNLDWVRIMDYQYYASVNRWALLPIGNMPMVRLRQEKAQKLYSTGSVVEWTQEVEDSFGFWDSGDPGIIVMKEPGVYQIDTAIQWDPQVVPDVAHAIFMQNGIETDQRDQRYLRGNLYTPGFSQTLAVSGKLRFAENDTFSLKTKYTASASLLDQIFSYFDTPSKIKSRLDISYLGP